MVSTCVQDKGEKNFLFERCQIQPLRSNILPILHTVLILPRLYHKFHLSVLNYFNEVINLKIVIVKEE